MNEVEAVEAEAGEVEFKLAWQETSGGLEGTLEAVNICEHPVTLTGKPGLMPLGADGEPLDAIGVVSLEARIPGYVVLRPGEKAIAPVGWAGWDGPPASGVFVVSWNGGRTEVRPTGPAQPQRTGPTTNLWSSWFETAG
ncbi:DUF4232 domain-containing protein [Kribbella monticola]|uniref:DUF4232 domain-containing protein n=1 Tax=Kribbella monticola TaxID=2185285 RepID=UPI000DD4434F|nr:DUF4232 domain-containing protein [Kribbella monticola]